jgi:RNA polymerase sigma factor (sigma-70 family)
VRIEERDDSRKGALARMHDTMLAEYARRVQNGDREGFRLLVESLSRPLLAMAYRYVLDWDSAGDITQDTWVKAFAAIARYDTRQPFRPWIFAIHRNTCMSFLRAEATRRTHESTYESSRREPAASSQSNPLDHAAQAEFRERLHAAMELLTERQRTAFSLVDLEQTSHAEASLILNMSHATLRTTLHFARKRLAAILIEMDGES